MLRRSSVLLWLVALLALCQQHASAETEVQLTTDVRGLIKLADGLRFANEAPRLNLTLSGIKLFRFHGDDEEPNYDRFGLFLVPAEGEAQIQRASGHCVLDDVNTLFTFRDSMVQHVISGGTEEATFSFVVTAEGTYSVYFANCAAPTFAVSLAVRLDGGAQPATGMRGCVKRMMRFGPSAMEAVGCVALVALLLMVVALGIKRRRSVQQASPVYEALPTAEPFPPVVVIPMAKGGAPAAVQAAAPKAAAGKEGVEGAAPVLAA